ncbi:formyltetrahydrofolate deformylase [Nesterenkonia sp. MY13]|uniref:Formyltetrahydrofolate deformylase n=1 Tax=Nesterenkonia sedimenti TaxID=1463632 RepID=A0A7X8YEM2_9MICC|nr:formyltetrahydrofolate deformylase [Nesterenkonia sedimenti]NLS10645.1 formyltetrahydrofolate deformylase [Nesterenkonia sedimenti]
MNTEQRPDIARLIISCPDQHGIVAAVSDLIAELGGNIIALDQYSTGVEDGQFFQRTVFHLPGFAHRRTEIEEAVAHRLAGPFSMDFQLTDASVPKRVAIFASKTDHCLLDLLWRHRRGELPVEIPMVISNHPDLAADVERFGIEFHHVPVDKTDKTAAEAEHLRLLEGKVDLVVLARYMQILSPEFLTSAGVPIINIHHSFLPAFIGAGPYQKAKDRGVKLIGATAHYVTEDLDEGPIIEQDVIRVSHADDVAQLTRYGADVERAVLSRAVKWHCEDRVIRHGNTTIVF